MREGKEAEVWIDFLPDSEKEGFAEKMLRARENVQQDVTVEEYFTGVLNKKLMTLFIRLAGLKSSEPAAGADVGKLLRVYELCREFRDNGLQRLWSPSGTGERHKFFRAASHTPLTMPRCAPVEYRLTS